MATLTLGRTGKVIASPWYKGGEEDRGSLSLEVLIYCSISKIFYLQRKAFDLPYKMLLEACDATKHGHHLGRHLGFCQELKIRQKWRELAIFCASYVE